MPDAMEIRFTLNGQDCVLNTDPKRSALTVLREDLGNTSLKPGCDPQGICGCCTALVDGKPRLTCTLPVKSLAGKAVLTQDGLSDFSARAISTAFASLGATACGYCIPGISMAASALIEKTPDPSAEDVEKGLQMHTCRCTGWVKIVEAVQTAARWTRQGAITPGPVTPGLGGDWQPASVARSVTGKRPYLDDMSRPGMLYGAVVWTPSARCKLLSIQTEAAAAIPGVRAVLTAADAPHDRRVGVARHDWPFLVAIGEETRCAADIFAVVAAETPEAARAAVAAITVQVESLAPVLDVAVAAEDAHNVLSTSRIARGDAHGNLEGCAHVVSARFQTALVDPTFIEPEAALVVPRDGGFQLYSAGEDIFEEQRQLCHLFQLAPTALTVESVPAGGAFGGRVDLGVSSHALLLAMKTGRPVKLALSMEDSTRYHSKRAPFTIDMRLGADAQGHLVAIDARILADIGAYASLGSRLVERAATHIAGAYRVANVHVEALAVLTNNPVAGVGRGLGVPQVNFALEGCMDRLAEVSGIDPLQLRLTNLAAPGEHLGSGQRVSSDLHSAAVLSALKPAYDAARAAGKSVGLSMALQGVGLGHGAEEHGAVVIEVVSARELRLHTPFAEQGQGHFTAAALMAAEATGLPPERFVVRCTTDGSVDCGPTLGGRATVLLGHALIEAGARLREAVGAGDLASLAGQRFIGRWRAPSTDTAGTPAREDHDPVANFSYGVAAQLVILDESGKVEQIIAAQDVGRVIHRTGCESQLEGAVHMGLGMALSESVTVDEHGAPELKFRNLGVIKPKGMPRISTILLENADSHGPWGARGVSETGCCPTAAAVASALHAHDGEWRETLPMNATAAAKALGARASR